MQRRKSEKRKKLTEIRDPRPLCLDLSSNPEDGSDACERGRNDFVVEHLHGEGRRGGAPGGLPGEPLRARFQLIGHRSRSRSERFLLSIRGYLYIYGRDLATGDLIVSLGRECKLMILHYFFKCCSS
ncbi:hypothetical protein ACLOJK_028429 [Asimina triloba]